MLRKQNQSLAQERTSSTNANAAKILSKGFGNLGEYLPAEKVSDAGNGTPEALLQTLAWAIREGKVERLEQIGAPFGGQSKPSDEAGKISESEAAMFKMVPDAFTNSAGFRLNSQMSDSGQKYDVRLDAEPLEGNRLSESLRDFNLSFVLEHKTNGWWFGNPSADSASK
ncbi:MAG TPA: hypothetical protein VFC07_07780 [Verrucomicrobiae bacterium]|nr:hypothetical protein [Verrucomicrobiae bacterium]